MAGEGLRCGERLANGSGEHVAIGGSTALGSAKCKIVCLRIAA